MTEAERRGPEPQTLPDAAIRRRRLLGVGLRADPVSAAATTRDISLRRGETGVDLDTVEGVDNLCQDLAIGLTTLRGTDVFNQRFGFLGLGALTQESSPVLAREGIRSAVIEFLVTDPRVRRIVDLNVEGLHPGGSGRSLSVRVHFETITGQRATAAGIGLLNGRAAGLIGAAESRGALDAGSPQ